MELLRSGAVLFIYQKEERLIVLWCGLWLELTELGEKLFLELSGGWPWRGLFAQPVFEPVLAVKRALCAAHFWQPVRIEHSAGELANGTVSSGNDASGEMPSGRPLGESVLVSPAPSASSNGQWPALATI